MDLDEVAQKAQEALDSTKSAHHRLDALEDEVKDIRGLTAAMAAVNQKVDGLKDTVGEIKDDLKAITSKPSKWLDKIVELVLAAIVGGAITFAIAHVFR